MRPWLTKGEYELYVYLKGVGQINTSISELARKLNKDKGDTIRRIHSLERKGYIMRKDTYIQII